MRARRPGKSSGLENFADQAVRIPLPAQQVIKAAYNSHDTKGHVLPSSCSDFDLHSSTT